MVGPPVSECSVAEPHRDLTGQSYDKSGHDGGSRSGPGHPRTRPLELVDGGRIAALYMVEEGPDRLASKVLRETVLVTTKAVTS
jgi:hypothetical protein